MSESPLIANRFAWPFALAGIGLFTFSIVGLSGPGRIDSADAQTQFDVGKSLVEHGDSIIRDDRIWWRTSPGRAGNIYADRGTPQALVAMASILTADATSWTSEGRRHFFYVLGGASEAGILSVLYAIWFRRQGCRPLLAILWALGGIFCTPMWFYATGGGDQCLGSALVIAALTAAKCQRAALAGLLIGLAYNVDPPLAFFAAPAVALLYSARGSRAGRCAVIALIAAGLLGGVLVHQAYDAFKFDVEHATQNAEQRLLLYGPRWTNHPGAVFAALLASLGAGALFYCPTALLGARGLISLWKVERLNAFAVSASVIVFLGYICMLADFKGEPSWGPRLLTPVFAVLWLHAWQGAAKLPQSLLTTLLALGFAVQIMGLSIDPQRLFVERDISTSFAREAPLRYFDPAMSHLINRPREIAESIRAAETSAEYSPVPSPTFAFPSVDPLDPEARWPSSLEHTRFNQRLQERGPDVVRRYRVLSSFRPWWWSMKTLPADEKPVNLGKAAALLLFGAGCGLIVVGLSVRTISSGEASQRANRPIQLNHHDAAGRIAVRDERSGPDFQPPV